MQPCMPWHFWPFAVRISLDNTVCKLQYPRFVTAKTRQPAIFGKLVPWTCHSVLPTEELRCICSCVPVSPQSSACFTMSKLSDGQRELITHLHRRGHSYSRIAADLKISRSTVSYWVNKGTTCLGRDRQPRVVSHVLVGKAAASRAADLLMSGDQGGTRFVAQQLHKEGLVDRPPSRQTVARAAKSSAKAAGKPLVFKRGRPVKGLTPRNKQLRVAFCRANMKRDWDKVMFTDRCKFSFRFPGSRVGCGRWVTRGGRNQHSVYMPNHPQVYNVYGGITVHGATVLMPVTGTSGLRTRYKNKKGVESKNITAAEYTDIVGRGLLPAGDGVFASAYQRKWVLQQDGDPTHRAARAVVQKHNRQGMSEVEILANWPGNSPDLSPIENVWAIVDRKVAMKGCKTFEEFKREVDKAFRRIPKGTLSNLFKSVPKRLRLCVENEGAKIKY